MSRSYKNKRIIKDKSRYYQKLGNRALRKRIKDLLNNYKEDTIIPESKKEFVNDYSVSDYKIRIYKDNEDFFTQIKGKNKKLTK